MWLAENMCISPDFCQYPCDQIPILNATAVISIFDYLAESKRRQAKSSMAPDQVALLPGRDAVSTSVPLVLQPGGNQPDGALSSESSGAGPGVASDGAKPKGTQPKGTQAVQSPSSQTHVTPGLSWCRAVTQTTGTPPVSATDGTQRNREPEQPTSCDTACLGVCRHSVSQ